MADDVATAVAGTLVDMFGMPNDEPPEQPEAGAPVVVPEPDDTDTDLPDEIAALLDEPDLELEPDEEPDLSEYQDAEELARELARTKKRLKYVEEQNVAKGRKEWRREAKKYFQYADIDSIDATSRKAFLREAAQQHDQIKGRVDAAISEERKKLTAVQQVEQAAAREAAAASWGKPVAGGAPSAPPAQTTADDRLQDARRRRDLQAQIRARVEADNL